MYIRKWQPFWCELNWGHRFVTHSHILCRTNIHFSPQRTRLQLPSQLVLKCRGIHPLYEFFLAFSMGAFKFMPSVFDHFILGPRTARNVGGLFNLVFASCFVVSVHSHRKFQPRAPLIAGPASIDCTVCFAKIVSFIHLFLHWSIASEWSVSQSVFLGVYQFAGLLSIPPPFYLLFQWSVTESFNHI